MHLSCAIRGSLEKAARVCALTAACTVGLFVFASSDSAQAGKGFGGNASTSGENRVVIAQATTANSNFVAGKYPAGTEVRDHRKCKKNLAGRCRPTRPGR